MRLLEEIQFPDSLGLLYSAFTYFCGFRVNGGEGKLMGLASYEGVVERHRHLALLADGGDAVDLAALLVLVAGGLAALDLGVELVAHPFALFARVVEEPRDGGEGFDAIVVGDGVGHVAGAGADPHDGELVAVDGVVAGEERQRGAQASTLRADARIGAGSPPDSPKWR